MHANIELKFHLRNHNTLSYRNSELYVATFANKGGGVDQEHKVHL